MILVDPRVGSVELQPLLESLHLKTKLQHLDSADFAFSGNGPKGLAMVGIERKRLRDALQSMETGRFCGRQLPALLESYDFCYLIVEGSFRANPESGVLEDRRGDSWQTVRLGSQGFTYRQLDNWITTLECMTPRRFVVRRTGSAYASAVTVGDLWHWWNDKAWHEHSSLKIFDQSADVAFSLRPGLVRRVAKELWKIGWEKSAAVEARFGSVKEMIEATEQDWREIPGIGEKIAGRVFREIRGLAGENK